MSNIFSIDVYIVYSRFRDTEDYKACYCFKNAADARSKVATLRMCDISAYWETKQVEVVVE